jgi:hypothetical protein
MRLGRGDGPVESACGVGRKIVHDDADDAVRIGIVLYRRDRACSGRNRRRSCDRSPSHHARTCTYRGRRTDSLCRCACIRNRTTRVGPARAGSANGSRRSTGSGFRRSKYRLHARQFARRPGTRLLARREFQIAFDEAPLGSINRRSADPHGAGNRLVTGQSNSSGTCYSFHLKEHSDKWTLDLIYDRFCSRSLPSLRRRRHSIKSRVIGTAPLPKSRRTSAAYWSRNCSRSACPMRIWMNMAMSMQPFHPMSKSQCRSSASARTWTPRPTSVERTSSRGRWSNWRSYGRSGLRCPNCPSGGVFRAGPRSDQCGAS